MYTLCAKQDCSGYELKTYQSLIGSLMCLAVISLPVIAHTVPKLAQLATHPEKEHFIAAKQILRYLKQNPKDSDWGSNKDDRNSYSRFVIFMAGGPISWECKKQSIVALSYMEAEYVAMCQGTEQVVFHQNILSEPNIIHQNPNK